MVTLPQPRKFMTSQNRAKPGNQIPSCDARTSQEERKHNIVLNFQPMQQAFSF